MEDLKEDLLEYFDKNHCFVEPEGPWDKGWECFCLDTFFKTKNYTPSLPEIKEICIPLLKGHFRITQRKFNITAFEFYDSNLLDENNKIIRKVTVV